MADIEAAPSTVTAAHPSSAALKFLSWRLKQRGQHRAPLFGQHQL
jgi:hypothetical protein